MAGREILTFSRTPGKGAEIRGVFPAGGRIALDAQRDSLLVFLHPRCSCSKATLGELNRLLPHISGRMKVLVVFDQPTGTDAAWVKDENWEIARNLPGVELLIDEGSQEFERFKVHTSGQAFLFSKTGDLLFSGGITPLRGHMGDSLGREAILARGRGEVRGPASAAVFGCAVRSKLESGGL